MANSNPVYAETFSTNNPTVDGAVWTINQNGTSCPAPSTKDDNGSGVTARVPSSSTATVGCWRGYIEWPISSIPDNAVITNVTFRFDITFANSPANCNIVPVTTRPSTASAHDLWNQIGNNTPYISNNNFCLTSGDNKALYLEASAIADLQNQLGSNWFGVGFKVIDESRSGVNRQIRIEEEESPGTPDPTLEVTYYIPQPPAGYQYRRNITLSYSGSVLTDYQVNFTMNTAALISAGKMRSDCADINVTDSDMGTPLSYWLESGCNTGSTTIWTKVPSIPNGGKDIYVFYGKPNASTNASSINNTFDIYETFEGGLNGWTDYELAHSANCDGGANAYPDTNIDTGSGNPSPSIHKGPEALSSHYDCFVGFNKSIDIPGNVNISIQLDGRSKAGHVDPANLFLRLYPYGGITVSNEVFSSTLSAGGTLDTGWNSHGPFENTNTVGLTKVNVFIFTSDAWTADWNKEIWADNIRVRKVVQNHPSAILGSEAFLGSSSYTTSGGGPSGWSWGSVSGPVLIKSGTPYNWTWQVWTPGSGRKVPQGTPYSWTWGNE